jgi:hypothetical protein
MDGQEDLLKQHLECPVCITVPRSAPVFQCNNGHIACEQCYARLIICPSCREVLPKPGRRNLVAENVIEACNFDFPCSNVKTGCGHAAKRSSIGAHEAECPWRLVPCPDTLCQKMISLKVLQEHRADKHCVSDAAVFDDGDEQRADDEGKDDRGCERVQSVRWNWSPYLDKSSVHYVPASVKFDGNIFFLMMNKKSELFHMWLAVASGEREANKYRVDLSLDGPQTSVSHYGKVYPIDVKWTEVIADPMELLFFSTLRCKQCLVPNKHSKKGPEDKDVLKVTYKIVKVEQNGMCSV